MAQSKDYKDREQGYSKATVKAQSNGDSLFIALDAVFRKVGLHPGNDETDTQFFDEVYSVAKQDRKQHEIDARIDELENRLRVQFIPSHWERLRNETNSWAKYVDRRLSELKTERGKL